MEKAWTSAVQLTWHASTLRHDCHVPASGQTHKLASGSPSRAASELSSDLTRVLQARFAWSTSNSDARRSPCTSSPNSAVSFSKTRAADPSRCLASCEGPWPRAARDRCPLSMDGVRSFESFCYFNAPNGISLHLRLVSLVMRSTKTHPSASSPLPVLCESKPVTTKPNQPRLPVLLFNRRCVNLRPFHLVPASSP